MMNRAALRDLALALAATGLVSACQPTAHHPTAQEQAAAAAAIAAQQSALAAATASQQARTYDTVAEDKMITHPLFTGAAIQPVKQTPGLVAALKSSSPAELEAQHKASALHKAEATPAPALRP